MKQYVKLPLLMTSGNSYFKKSTDRKSILSHFCIIIASYHSALLSSVYGYCFIAVSYIITHVEPGNCLRRSGIGYSKYDNVG